VRDFEIAGSKVELFATPAPNCAGEIARAAAARGCTLILAAGGDGTINEVVNGIAGTDISFGALPSGTANVLANEIGLANRPDHAAKQLLNAVPVRIPLGYLSREGQAPRYFVLMAGVGLDAKIVYHLDLKLKNRFGKLAYWHGGFQHLRGNLPRFHTIVNGESWNGTFTLITKVRNYGGDFEIARHVKLMDDDFEVVIFQKDTWPDYVRFLAGVMLDRLREIDGVVIRRASSVQVIAPEDSRRIYIQTDGESLGALPATIGTMPNALTLLVPPKYLVR
jgi:diacylglycerol kinase (ATP)